MTLCRLLPRDLDSVMRIEELCFGDTWSRSQWESEIKQDSENVYAMAWQMPQGIVGFALGHLVLDEYELFRIAVDPQYQRMGIAQNLLSEQLRWAQIQGAQRAFLEVRTSAEAAYHLYCKLGFKVLGRRKQYYRDGEDAWLMECTCLQ
jgi:ribosomal-protein-alanine N-acetyltransferase